MKKEEETSLTLFDLVKSEQYYQGKLDLITKKNYNSINKKTLSFLLLSLPIFLYSQFQNLVSMFLFIWQINPIINTNHYTMTINTVLTQYIENITVK